MSDVERKPVPDTGGQYGDFVKNPNGGQTRIDGPDAGKVYPDDRFNK